MNNSIQQWLEHCGSPPGIIACGLRQPDGKLVCRNIEADCPAGMMEQIFGGYEDLRNAGLTGELAPRWHTWTFEQGRLRFVERPDGWVFCLVARAGSAAAANFDMLSRDFLSLEPGN